MGNKVKTLSGKILYKRLYCQGNRLKGRGIILRYIENKDKRGLQLAYGISKKVVRKAHQRNKIKRWGRVCLRNSSVCEGRSFDLLMIITKNWDDYREFEQAIESLLNKITK